MTATLTSKGQVTIPAKIRQSLGLRKGDKLEADHVVKED
jgi:AbrB family looped-hinge helix DNA binding protein